MGEGVEKTGESRDILDILSGKVASGNGVDDSGDGSGMVLPAVLARYPDQAFGELEAEIDLAEARRFIANQRAMAAERSADDPSRDIVRSIRLLDHRHELTVAEERLNALAKRANGLSLGVFPDLSRGIAKVRELSQKLNDAIEQLRICEDVRKLSEGVRVAVEGALKPDIELLEFFEGSGSRSHDMKQIMAMLDKLSSGNIDHFCDYAKSRIRGVECEEDSKKDSKILECLQLLHGAYRDAHVNFGCNGPRVLSELALMGRKDFAEDPFTMGNIVGNIRGLGDKYPDCSLDFAIEFVETKALPALETLKSDYDSFSRKDRPEKFLGRKTRARLLWDEEARALEKRFFDNVTHIVKAHDAVPCVYARSVSEAIEEHLKLIDRASALYRRVAKACKLFKDIEDGKQSYWDVYLRRGKYILLRDLLRIERQRRQDTGDFRQDRGDL